MSTSTYLSITLVEESQNNKEVTMNEAIEICSAAIAGALSVDLNGLSGDQTLTSTQATRCFLIQTSGALAADVNLLLPAGLYHGYLFYHNGTGYDCTLKYSGGSGVTLSPGDAQFVFGNGTTVFGIDAAGSPSSQPTEKTQALLNGAGGTTDIAIGANIQLDTEEVYVQGFKMRRNVDYSITESSPGSGNYDQITPLISDSFPVGTQNVEINYY